MPSIHRSARIHSALLATLWLLDWTTYTCGGAPYTPAASRRSLLSYENRYPLFVPRMVCRDDNGWDNEQFGSSEAVTFDECAAACDDKAECSGIMYGLYDGGSSQKRCRDATNTQCTCWLVLEGCLHPETHRGYNIYMRETAQSYYENRYPLFVPRMVCRDDNGWDNEQFGSSEAVTFDECAAACDDKAECSGILFGLYDDGSSQKRCRDATNTQCTCWLVLEGCSHPETHRGYNIYLRDTAQRYTQSYERAECRDAGGAAVDQEHGTGFVSFDDCAAACDDLLRDDLNACHGIMFGNHLAENSECASADQTSCTCRLVTGECTHPIPHEGFNIFTLLTAAPITTTPTAALDVTLRYPLFATEVLCKDGGAKEDGVLVSESATFDECAAACDADADCFGFIFGLYRTDAASRCTDAAGTTCKCYKVYNTCATPQQHLGYNIYVKDSAPREPQQFTLSHTGQVCRTSTGSVPLGDSVGGGRGDFSGWVPTMEECEAACANNPQCSSFAFGVYRTDGDRMCVSATEAHCDCYVYYEECGSYATSVGHNLYHRAASTAPTTSASTYELKYEGAVCRGANGDTVTEEYGDGSVSFDDCAAACSMSGGNGGGSIHSCHGIVYGNYLAQNSQCASATQTSCTCMLVTGQCSHPAFDEGFNIFRWVAALLASPEPHP